MLSVTWSINRYLVVSSSDHCSSYRTKNPKSVIKTASIIANRIKSCFELAFFVMVPDIKTILSLFELFFAYLAYIYIEIDDNHWPISSDQLIVSTNERFYATFMVRLI